MKSVLSAPHFQNEEAAFAYVESKLWPSGPECPHCGVVGQAGRLKGKTTRPGLWKCYACRKPFTVRMGSGCESSHVPMTVWLQAMYLMCASKKGISTRQLQRMIGCGLKTAWFLGHRIREAMTPDANAGPLGGAGKTVEADETALTNSRKTKRPPGRKRPHAIVLSLVERGGNIRSVTLDHRGVARHLRKMVHKESRLVTDKAQYYIHPPVASHESVDHSRFEWARGDVHVNTLEGFFSVVKRGLVGVYQHVDKKHLDRYLAEFDFRQNTRVRLGISDEQRADLALKGFAGKRLTYQT